MREANTVVLDLAHYQKLEALERDASCVFWGYGQQLIIKTKDEALKELDETLKYRENEIDRLRSKIETLEKHVAKTCQGLTRAVEIVLPKRYQAKVLRIVNNV